MTTQYLSLGQIASKGLPNEVLYVSPLNKNTLVRSINITNHGTTAANFNIAVTSKLFESMKNAFVGVYKDPLTYNGSIMVSTDLINWNYYNQNSVKYTSSTSFSQNRLKYVNGVYFLTSPNQSSSFMASTDAVNWISYPFGGDLQEVLSIVYRQRTNTYLFFSGDAMSEVTFVPGVEGASYVTTVFGFFPYLTHIEYSPISDTFVGLIPDWYAGLYFSSDGQQWTWLANHASYQQPTNLKYIDGKFVLLYANTAWPQMYSVSADGIVWSDINYNDETSIYDRISYGDNKVILHGTNWSDFQVIDISSQNYNLIMRPSNGDNWGWYQTSTDGIYWNSIGFPSPDGNFGNNSFNKIFAAGGKAIAFKDFYNNGYAGTLVTDDGYTWTEIDQPWSNNLGNISFTYNPNTNTYLIGFVDTNNAWLAFLYYSTDLINWTMIEQSFYNNSGPSDTIQYGNTSEYNGYIVANWVGSHYSTDLMTWSMGETPMSDAHLSYDKILNQWVSNNFFSLSHTKNPQYWGTYGESTFTDTMLIALDYDQAYGITNNNGETWATSYLPFWSAVPQEMSAVFTYGQYFYAIDNISAQVYRSIDGFVWETIISSPLSWSWASSNHFKEFNSLLYIVNEFDSNPMQYSSSTDGGLSWSTPVLLPDYDVINDATMTQGRLLKNSTGYLLYYRYNNAGAYNPTTGYVSTDLITWADVELPLWNDSYINPEVLNDLFIMYNNDTLELWSSTDGITWDIKSHPGNGPYYMKYANGTYVMADNWNPTLFTSTDMITWSTYDTPTVNWGRMATYNNTFVFIGEGDPVAIYTSTDGANWNSIGSFSINGYGLGSGFGFMSKNMAPFTPDLYTLPDPYDPWTDWWGDWGRVFFGKNGRYFLEFQGYWGTLYYSDDQGLTWNTFDLPQAGWWDRTMKYIEPLDRIVATNEYGSVIYSDDNGETWSYGYYIDGDLYQETAYTTFINKKPFFNAQSNFGLYHYNPLPNSINQMVYNNGKWVSVDNNGLMTYSTDLLTWSLMDTANHPVSAMVSGQALSKEAIPADSYIFKNTNINAGETITIKAGYSLEPNSNLIINSTSTDVTFSAFGAQI